MKFKVGDFVSIIGEVPRLFRKPKIGSIGIGTVLIVRKDKCMINTNDGVHWIHNKRLKLLERALK